jgi:hypothetical protein
MYTYDLSHALTSLRPGAGWHMIGDMTDYSNIVWTDDTQTCPTEQELLDEVARLQSEYDAKGYQRLRAKEYPSFVDQFDLLYHGGYDAWKTAIDVIKNKYPKP